MEIRVPKLGEGAESGVVINLLVREGDLIKKDQIIVELENEKAVAPIPSPETGIVESIRIKVGDRASVGQLLMILRPEGAGTGVGESAGSTALKDPAPEPLQSPDSGSLKAGPEGRAQDPRKMPEAPAYRYESKTGLPPPASPAIRRLARDLGIDLDRVQGSESGGRIGLADLKAYVARLQALVFSRENPIPEEKTVATSSGQLAVPADFSQWGPVIRKPLSNLRKVIADRLRESWQTIPHVTQHHESDITGLMAGMKQYAQDYEKEGVKLTLTAVIIKVCASVLAEFPNLNSSMDEAAGEQVLKEYCHIGFAVDTDQGLFVPVIRDVRQKNLKTISGEIILLAGKAKQRTLAAEELKGGCFTVSNLGGIGGGHFTPIINKPEAAILGVNRARLKTVLLKGNPADRVFLPLSLSYDHRLIDGAEGARFIQKIVDQLEQYPEENLKI